MALRAIAVRPALTPRLWRRWTLATAAGELVGFAVPAAVGVGAIVARGEPTTLADYLTVIALILPAGLAEGAILGFAQWTALRHAVRSVPAHRWIGATSLAAGAAWLAALLFVTLRDLATLPAAGLIALAAPVGLVVLGSIGVAQWLVLRRELRAAGWWAPANVAAWLAGLPISFIGPSLVPDGSPAAAWLAAGVLSGLLMGLVVGAVTGLALVRIIARQRMTRSPIPR